MALNTGERHFNWHNFIITYFISYGQLAFGYPASIISTTLGSPIFSGVYGLGRVHLFPTKLNPNGEATSKQNTVTGATNGVFQSGAFVNTFITCYLLEKVGRKNTINYNALVGLLGGAIITGSQNIGMFLAGRWFTGISSWGFLISTPLYTSERSPPDLRGFYTGLNGVHIGLGYLLAACMGRAFVENTTQANWRRPLGIYLLFPLIMIVITIIAPESPRWLLLKGKTEKARKIVYKLHTIKGNDDFVRLEFQEMEKQIAIDKTLETSWMSMFRKPSYRKRTIVCCFYCFIGPSTAVLVISNYGPTFYKALGEDTIGQINFQVGWASLPPPFCLLGAVLLDRVGRRILLLIGIGGCCLCLCIEAAAVAQFTKHPENLALGKLGTAALYMFNVCYNLGVDVGGNVFYAEVFPNHIRHMGVSITNVVLALTDLVYLQVTALAFTNIGYQCLLVFISICVVGFVILWFLLPETKGIPLEEMGKLFGDEAETSLYNEDQPVSTVSSDEEKAKDRGDIETNGHQETVDVEKGRADVSSARPSSWAFDGNGNQDFNSDISETSITRYRSI